MCSGLAQVFLVYIIIAYILNFLELDRKNDTKLAIQNRSKASVLYRNHLRHGRCFKRSLELQKVSRITSVRQELK